MTTVIRIAELANNEASFYYNINRANINISDS